MLIYFLWMLNVKCDDKYNDKAMTVIKHNQKTLADIPLHWNRSRSWSRKIPRSWMRGRRAEMGWGGRCWGWETGSGRTSDLQTVTALPCWPPVTWTASHWRKIPVLVAKWGKWGKFPKIQTHFERCFGFVSVAVTVTFSDFYSVFHSLKCF